MRTPLALLFVALAACSADPVLLPDAGPCNGACGAGTVCQAGACVTVDAGTVDVGSVDVGGGMDAPQVVDVSVDAGAVDAGADVLVDVDLRASEVCRAVTAVCDGRGVDIQAGERDGGRTYHCGGCGRTCAAGEGCLNCNCVRL